MFGTFRLLIKEEVDLFDAEDAARSFACRVCRPHRRWPPLRTAATRWPSTRRTESAARCAVQVGGHTALVEAEITKCPRSTNIWEVIAGWINMEGAVWGTVYRRRTWQKADDFCSTTALFLCRLLFHFPHPNAHPSPLNQLLDINLYSRQSLD